VANQKALATLRHSDQVVHASKWIPKTIRRRENFLCTLFSALDSNEVRYCVLHSWEELPEKLTSDLDVAVHPEDICGLVSVFRLLREEGYIPVQVLNYFVNAYYFVFAWFEGSEINYVAVDIIFEHRRGGLIVPSGEELVSDRRRQSIFWIPAPESEFTYLLAKKTWKGAVAANQALRLRTLIKALGRPEAERLAGQIFLGKLRERIVEACASGCAGEHFRQFKNQTWKTGLVRNPLRFIAYLLSDAVRRVHRWLQPTGLLLVVMGPDGTGKSTLIENLVQSTEPAFRRHRVFHWRPMLLWRRKIVRDSTQPHSLAPHASWWSIIHLFAHLLDYWVGYWLVIRPLLARSGIVVFDRYFHDVLADPKRYRYGGPLYLVKFMSRLVPKPDLALILDAPLDVILSRKQEVPAEEVLFQKRTYLQMAGSFPHSLVIDSRFQIAQVSAQAGRAVVEYLAQRFEHRHAQRVFIPSPSFRSRWKDTRRRLFN